MSRRPRSDDDEDDWTDGQRPVVGTAQPGTSERTHPAAVLWVPDPEQRRGWRELYVDKPGSAAPRSVGFRKPGQR